MCIYLWQVVIVLGCSSATDWMLNLTRGVVLPWNVYLLVTGCDCSWMFLSNWLDVKFDSGVVLPWNVYLLVTVWLFMGDLQWSYHEMCIDLWQSVIVHGWSSVVLPWNVYRLVTECDCSRVIFNGWQNVKFDLGMVLHVKWVLLVTEFGCSRVILSGRQNVKIQSLTSQPWLSYIIPSSMTLALTLEYSVSSFQPVSYTHLRAHETA